MLIQLAQVLWNKGLNPSLLRQTWRLFSTRIDVEKRATKLIYDIIKGNGMVVSLKRIQDEIEKSGILWSDRRFGEFRQRLEARMKHDDIDVTHENFAKLLENDLTALELMCKVFSRGCVIPNFNQFKSSVTEIFLKADENMDGAVADYIPHLAEVNPDSWGISVCTIDGQRLSLGDSYQPFCMQSCVKPLAYAIAASDYRSDFVHQFVGLEPSGRLFNSLRLNWQHKPHNPMINAGAIVVCSLIERERPLKDRVKYVMNRIIEMCDGEIGFDSMVYESEKMTSYRNYAISYQLMENKCFPVGTDIHENMKFYLSLCAATISCDNGAAVGATLANGGVNPLYSGKRRVLLPAAVRNTLSLMHSCGMYDYSGKFAFHVGLPAKSGVAGGLIVVVPNVMGVMCRSPRLDARGNSVKGVQFFRDLVERYNFHVYDNLHHMIRKTNPRELLRELTEPEMELAAVYRKLFSRHAKESPE